jgi:short-subunit dehydrogenase
MLRSSLSPARRRAPPPKEQHADQRQGLRHHRSRQRHGPRGRPPARREGRSRRGARCERGRARRDRLSRGCEGRRDLDDITYRAQVEALPAAIIAAHGQVDGLLNVAGIIQRFVPVAELGFDQIERVIDVNLYGTINTVKAFLPELVKRPEAALVNVASMGAYAPVPGQSIYGATKAAVAQLSRSLHSELMATNVAVTGVFPGAISTNIAANSGVMTAAEMEAMAAKAGAGKPRTTTSAQEAGRQIVEAIEKSSYEIFIGQDARLSRDMSRLSPKRAAALIYSQMKDLLG